MLFLVDKVHQVIFGWSHKCGCSHIKGIFRFLQNNKIDNVIHTVMDDNILPDDIENYITIIISRNPYNRIISGFLDKYRSKGEFRHLWKHDTIIFTKFVNELIKNDWNMVEHKHFMPQTNGSFDKIILKSKHVKCYDIANIDYNYIEGLYNTKIPESLLSKKQGHERGDYHAKYNKSVYDLNMDEYYNFNIDIKFFYNDELKNKILNLWTYGPLPRGNGGFLQIIFPYELCVENITRKNCVFLP